MAETGNKSLVRRYYETIMNRRELGAIDEFLAPTFVSYGPSGPDFDRDAHIADLLC